MARRRVRRGPAGPPRSGTALLLAACALFSAVWAAAEMSGRGARAGTAAPLRPIPSLIPEPKGSAPLPVFATSEGVALRLVAPEAVAVAFHEASYGDAVELRPVGRCRVCRNRWKFEPPAPRRAGLPYIVTDTRGRSTPATSAADVVLPGGTSVAAPVTGTVSRVKRYRLYGRYQDVRVEIRPESAPDRRVVMLHLAGVTLARGDRVTASSTRIGSVRSFPFESQVDRYVPGRHPHVHLEVKDPAARRRPPKGS